MKAYEHVTQLPAPPSAVRAMINRPGGFLRFSPAGMIRVVDGNPDDPSVGSTFTLEVSPPVVPVLKFKQIQRVVHADGDTVVMEQVEGQYKRYRHEILLADGADGGTQLTDRVTYEAPAMAGDMTGQLERQFRFRARQMHGDLELHCLLAGRSRRILIAGASGLIGTQLTALLSNAGQHVGRLVRAPDKGYAVGTPIPWQPGTPLNPETLDSVDAVINLSGESIGGRFTEAKKRDILQSRLEATGTLARAVAHHPETALIQASAIGVYGARRPGELLSEDSAPGDGFLADVVRQWEAAAHPAVEAGARTAFLRTGIVLSQAGGALAPQVPLFLAFAGGRMAARNAMTSWVGIDDVARAYAHAVAVDAVAGPQNLVGPHPVTHQEFAEALARVLNRKAWLPVPGFGPRLLLGSEGYDQLIDTDQNVSSARLLATGFRFHEPTVEEALAHTLIR